LVRLAELEINFIKVVLDIEVQVAIIFSAVLLQQFHLEYNLFGCQNIEGDLAFVPGFDGDIELRHVETVVLNI